VSSRASTAGGTAPPGTIVPRWEWRTFGQDLGTAEERFAQLEPERVQESEETYLLSPASDASVKVRDGLMDVKRLQQVDDDGLEQWLPVLKAPFPLAADDVRTVFEALELPAPELDRGEYELAELVEAVEASPARAVEVHKRRARYLLDGCASELTEIRTPAGRTRTIAVESSDAGEVAEAVRSLGLPLWPNTCVARGLKQLLGLAGPRFAVIDVGTNSVKFVVAERLDGGWSTVVDRAEVTRLGERLQKTGRLGKQPIERTADAVAEMAAEATRDGAVEIAAVGTAGLRIAPNREDFLAAVERRCGLRVEIIPGEEEARLAYLATKAALGLGDESLAVFDTGGGSSQFTFGRGARVDERFSVPVGAVRFTEQFGLDAAVEEARVGEALDAIGAALSTLEGRPRPDALVGMGGAVTNLAAVKHELASYDPDIVRGTVLDRAEVERQVELYRSRSAAERREIVGLQPKRAELILAGACVVLTVLRKLGAQELTVSDRGLRHGLLVERFGGGSR